MGSNSGFCQKKSDSPLVIDFFESLHHYDFEKSKGLLKKIEWELKNLPESDLSTSNYYWWLMMTGEQNKINRKAFRKANQSLIIKYGKSSANGLSSDELFAIIHGYAYKTRYALHKRKYIQGLSNLKKILPFMKIVLDNPKQNEKFTLLAGLYHYLAAVSVEERPILKPLFNLAPKSNRSLGYQLLVSAAQSTHPLISTEATYFLMKINLEVSEDNNEALKWCRKLVNRYPENILYHYYLMQCYLELNRYDDVELEYELIRNLSTSNNGISNEQRHYFIKEAGKLKKRKK